MQTTIAKKAAVVKTDKEDMMKVYEIGYLLVSSIPKEKVAENVTALKTVISKKGGSVIAEEEPEFRPLAYTMIKKIGAANHRFNEAYFGWVKFELPVSEIESVKKTFEEHANMLRTLVMLASRENTYLGKKAPVVVRSEDVVPGSEVVATADVASGDVAVKAPADAVVASVEDIDKSIDEMVK